MTYRPFAVAALVLGLASAAAAQSTATADARTGTGVGVVRAVDARAGTITLQHGPIAALGWPGMTMAFKARSPAVMHAARVGRTVAFGVRVAGADAEVTSITPR